MRELKIEDLNELYDNFIVFLKDRKFEEEYNTLLESRPTLSIDKESEYSSLVKELLYEFLSSNGYTTMSPLIISFILQFDRLYYGKMQETYVHCYR
jgi:hypothetical protein